MLIDSLLFRVEIEKLYKLPVLEKYTFREA
jgi:hypothetical protein